jgi:hypothetical protein
LERNDGPAKPHIEETSGTSAGRALPAARNGGLVFVNYEDKQTGNVWQTSGNSTLIKGLCNLLQEHDEEIELPKLHIDAPEKALHGVSEQ